jgi:hypothetical protein
MFFPDRSRGHADLPRDASSDFGGARWDRPFPLPPCPTGPGAPDVALPAEFFGERVLDIPTYVVRATLYLFSKLVGRWLLSREESLPETDVFEVQLPVRLLGLSFELEAAGVDITPENLRREARVGVQYPNRT